MDLAELARPGRGGDRAGEGELHDTVDASSASWVQFLVKATRDVSMYRRHRQ